MNIGAGTADNASSYRVGTLSYTTFGLVNLFIWMLWGDFCFSMMELLIPNLLPLYLRMHEAPNWLIGLIVGCFAALLIYLLRGVIVAYYQVSDEARTIAWELLDAILFIVIFQSMNAILTKGVLRAGGDTKFLMAGDILFLWVASIPLGTLAGLNTVKVKNLTMKIDQIIKCVWCFFRLRSRKWMKTIHPAGAMQMGE